MSIILVQHSKPKSETVKKTVLVKSRPATIGLLVALRSHHHSIAFTCLVALRSHRHSTALTSFLLSKPPVLRPPIPQTMAPQPSMAKLSLPFKTRIFISLLSTVSDAACRSDGSVNRLFLRLFDYKVAPNPNPTNSVSTSDITVDASHNLWFRLFSPSLPSDILLPVVIFFHGGGFTFLSAASQGYDAVCRRFARKLPAFVVSVNYRLAPEHTYPSQYDDGFDVLKFLDENRDAILPGNADLSRCFLAGDSAGGNIAHHVAVRACKAEFKTLKLRGLVCIQPFFGGEDRTEAELELVGVPLVSVPRSDFCWKAFLPKGSSNRDHPAVNVSGPNAESIAELDFPATMVVVAGFDPLKDWERRYYEWLKASGKEAWLIEYPSMMHAFYIFLELEESAQLIMQIKDFMINVGVAIHV